MSEGIEGIRSVLSIVNSKIWQTRFGVKNCLPMRISIHSTDTNVEGIEIKAADLGVEKLLLECMSILLKTEEINVSSIIECRSPVAKPISCTKHRLSTAEGDQRHRSTTSVQVSIF
ncbi:hypothetical protein CRE_23676 [Caenorhabditis remanei]|uniref:Uncharacterized protein n=1 Tax=Caenorhabditis remanei TaxID=31234 RepID=E3N499_CAERE|nr:hypothetical protein CRE_23676 [Caenorhabditis remanei]